MLVIQSAFRRIRATGRGEEGATILAVVGVMLVGFVVAMMVAAVSLFVIQTNYASSKNLQAVAAAEGGRDAVIASLTSAPTSCASSYSGTSPKYTVTVYATNSGTAPLKATDSGVTAGCPTGASKFIVLRSTGTAPTGQTETIDAVYGWEQTVVTRAGGAIGYRTGGYSTTFGTFVGDMVLRTGDFSCNLTGTLTGDVYVLAGNATFSVGSCTIDGNLYVSGNVTATLAGARIKGDVVAGGSVGGLGTVSVDGDVTAGSSISFLVSAGGTKKANQPAASLPYVPPLSEVSLRTGWIDLNASTVWPGFVKATPYAAGTCGTSVINDIQSKLATAGDPIVIDATKCTNNPLSLSFSSVTVARDAVLLFDKGLSSSLSLFTPGGTGDRQLFLVQVNTSTNPANPAPNCAGRTNGISASLSSAVNSRMHIMFYTPCGMSGSLGTSYYGQLFAPNPTSAIFSKFVCKPMWVTDLIDLTCDLDEPGHNGGISIVTGVKLGALVSQTEP